MNDIKCLNCGKKIGEENIQGGEVRIKCPKCGETTVIMSRLHAFPVKEESYTDRLNLEKKGEKKKIFSTKPILGAMYKKKK